MSAKAHATTAIASDSFLAPSNAETIREYTKTGCPERRLNRHANSSSFRPSDAQLQCFLIRRVHALLLCCVRADVIHAVTRKLADIIWKQSHLFLVKARASTYEPGSAARSLSSSKALVNLTTVCVYVWTALKRCASQRNTDSQSFLYWFIAL